MTTCARTPLLPALKPKLHQTVGATVYRPLAGMAGRLRHLRGF
jgi:hypothetical protein